jgi:hypothetical protein
MAPRVRTKWRPACVPRHTAKKRHTEKKGTPRKKGRHSTQKGTSCTKIRPFFFVEIEDRQDERINKILSEVNKSPENVVGKPLFPHMEHHPSLSSGICTINP